MRRLRTAAGLIVPLTAAAALASCGGGSSSQNSAAPGSGATAQIAAAVQNNLRQTLLVDAKVSCPSQALPGKGQGLSCRLHSKLASGTLTLTQEDAQGECFLYTGHAGPYSWTAANHNVVCVR